VITLLKFLVTASIITLCIIFHPYLTPQKIGDFIRANGAAPPLLFVVVCALRPILFFLPTMGLTIVAGVLFGAVWGAVYVAVGGAFSTITGFYFARWLGGNTAKKLIAKSNMLGRFERKSQQSGGRVILYMRLMNIPWDLVSYWAGVSGVRFTQFYVASLIPLIPLSFLYAYFGSSVFAPTSAGFIVSLSIIFILGAAPHIKSRLERKRDG
jgi:uncharacterized membrane protein YdjX (TVP38/TMEM64 family)